MDTEAAANAFKELGFTELKRFVQDLKQDLRPILNAPRYAWSNGMTEGHVNRLKMTKMYTLFHWWPRVKVSA